MNIIKEDPEVEYVAGFTGGGRGASNTANLFITLKPFEQRKKSLTEIMSGFRKKLAGLPGSATYLQAVQDLRIGGRGGTALYQYTLQASEISVLYEWAPLLVQRMRTLPELVDVASDQQVKGLQAMLTIDRDTASRLGVTAAMIDNILYDAFGQRQVSIIYSLLNQYRVVMVVEPRFWQSPDTLKEIYVKSAPGAMVPLGAFARFDPVPTSLAIAHQGQFPSVTVSFNLAPKVPLGDAVASIEKAKQEMGFPSSVRGSFSGTAQAFKDAAANQPLLIVAALLTVYIVLGILYESYIHPITILSTLPSAGVGALLALLICRVELSLIGLIGLFLLIGLVKKNGIMMVDFALETERREGKGPEDAIYEACLLRFRPIMMTTMAALLGALPLALGSGVGSELRRPLGITIVGGLVISQMLTLYTTPVMYLYLDRFRIWCKGKRKGLSGA